MMAVFRLSIVGLLASSSLLVAQATFQLSGGMDPGAAMMMREQQRMKQMVSSEEKIETISSYLTYELFLKHVFKSDMSLLKDEQQEDSMIPQGDFEFHNQMLIKAYSDMLAKDDILGLKKMIKGSPGY